MKRLIIAVMFATMAAFATDARANNISLPVNGVNGTFGWTAFHFQPSTTLSPFTDTFTFVGVTGSYLVDTLFTNIGLTPQSDVEFLSATLNSVPLTLQNGVLTAAFTLSRYSLTGPLTLVVTGTTGATTAINSSYGGTLNVTAVPEPASLMLLGAGLAGLGIWRRKAAAK